MPKRVYHPPKLHQSTWSAFAGALAIGCLIFLMLPFTQLLSSFGQEKELVELKEIAIPPPDIPPPPPPLPPPQEEKKATPPKPDWQEAPPPLDLSLLEASLQPGTGNAFQMPLAYADFGLAAPDTLAQMKIFELKDLDADPRAIFQIPPIYPFQLKRERIEGKVTLHIVIDEKGAVEKLQVDSSTHRGFESSAIEAVRQWKFQPGMRHGKPVKVKRLQSIRFTLK